MSREKNISKFQENGKRNTCCLMLKNDQNLEGTQDCRDPTQIHISQTRISHKTTQTRTEEGNFSYSYIINVSSHKK